MTAIETIKSEIVWPENIPAAGIAVKTAIMKIDNAWFWINIASKTCGKSGRELIMLAVKGELNVDEYGRKMIATRDGKIEIK